MNRINLVLTASLLLVCTSATAQEATATSENTDLIANPDRPTFFAAPAVVPTGRAQLEGGVQMASHNGANRLEVPVMVRTGVAKAFEFRAALPTPTVGIGDEPSDLGALQFSAKVAGNVTDSFSLGVLPFFDIASKSGDTTIFAQSQYGALALAGLAVGDFSLGFNGGVTVGPSSNPDSELREFFFPLALNLSYGFGDLGVSVEGFTIGAEQAELATGALLALSYRTSDLVVLDAFGAAGFSGDLPDAWFGLGVTFAK